MTDNVIAINAAPHDLDAERAIIGSIMLHADGYSQASDRITPEVFFNRNHGEIYDAMSSLARRGQDFSPISIKNELKRNGSNNNANILSELTSIMDAVHTYAGLETYCDIVMEKYVLRRLIAVSGFVTDKAREDGAEASDLLDQTEKKLFEISKQSFTGAGFRRIGDIIAESMPDVESMMPSSSPRTLGLPSPYTSLDNLTCGFQRANLVLIAGRPSMGKTSFALNVAHHLTTYHRVPVGIFSLEQSRDEIALRLLCAEASVDGQKLRRGRIRQSDIQALERAVKVMSDIPLYVDDGGTNSLKEIRAKARLLRARHNVEMIVVDYLQLMTSGRKFQNREQEIATISGSLKALAKELDIPILALSQLSRALENRDDKRPRLSDLRESGSLEQDCDVCIFLYRPEKYYDDEYEFMNVAEVIIGKQRNGPIGTVTMSFREGYTRFDDLAVPLNEHMGSQEDLF
jgi:replicative DNA helicase